LLLRKHQKDYLDDNVYFSSCLQRSFGIDLVSSTNSARDIMAKVFLTFTKENIPTISQTP